MVMRFMASACGAGLEGAEHLRRFSIPQIRSYSELRK